VKIATAVDVHSFAQGVSLIERKNKGEAPLKEHGANNDEAHLMLGLIEFPELPALEGHSDGDVIAHALADALLMACGAGDLGAIFGVDDPQWKNASGEKILQHAYSIILQKNYALESASVQIIAKRPRIAPKLQQIRAALSEVLEIDVACGATTTDGNIAELGSGNAIMAIATVLLK
jgi:2-C-methyl-D-erythritol 2,4-cyclodiphosphate synthase